MAVLSRQAIRTLLAGSPPLVEGMTDPDAQLQANGVDLTLASVAVFAGAGRIGASNAERRLPQAADMPFGADGLVHLAPGPYLITLAEAVHLPPEVMAFGKPRSSLLRAGAAVHNAVWDAGYSGRSQALLVVYNPAGLDVARGARVLQLVFLTLDSATDAPYAGRYQGEHLGEHVTGPEAVR